ncbi:redox-sensing transcriptional repressor Rex [Rhodococcus sp. EPR-157]|jgi:redox-sensing transcriptional repressor|uniref:redox-sensing transcriptional repressor Rex n=1 Tax=Rhodococcus sp. EPR-157 TaxID=1813677 RepID=UPI0007BBFB48|nr:redox-sensing transcriptional repressor Rex [Rhodococcus sp. EPR-157]KZF00170.1 redox-sensing transcriptional repressor Rex [Rhodococcus sp. EPR-157]
MIVTEERPAVPVGVERSPGIGRSASPERVIPQATVTRLATYLRVLGILADDGVLIVSSEELANAAGVGSAKLRKDLSFLGPNGVRGVGYDVMRLRAKIESALGLDRGHKVVLVGVGNLGEALARYGGFGRRGFSMVGLFDRNPERVGLDVDGLQVRHVDSLEQACRDLEATIGVIATPDESAQSVASSFVAGGVECILSFSPVTLDVPDRVEVRRVDLAVEMQVLSFNSSRNEAARHAPALSPNPRLGRSRGPRVVPGSLPSTTAISPSVNSSTRNGSVIAP